MQNDESNTIEMEQQLKDITDCCICLETYKEPKILPCIHTYCRGCLEEVGAKTNKCPGDGMPCPMCRKEFTIPENGFSGLQKNFFMDRLVEIRKMQEPSVDRALCDLCSEEGDTGSEYEIPSAKVYCVDCHQKLCQDCCRHHRKSKLSKNHKIIDLDGHIIRQDHIDTVLPTFCYQHDGKALEIYCSTCQEVVCAICFFEFHKTHDGLHINNIVEDFREQIKRNAENFQKYVTDLVEERSIAQKATDAYTRKTEEIEVEINAVREELKQLVSKHSESLLLQQKLLKQKCLKEFDIRKDEIETLIASFDSFEIYCKQITTMGSASDICGAVSNLNKRSEELSHMYKATKDSGMQPRDISLKISAILTSDDVNIIGKIEENGSPSTRAEVQPGSTDFRPDLPGLIIRQAPQDSDEECDQANSSKTEAMEESSNNALNEQLVEKVKGLQQDLETMKQKEMERDCVERGLRNYKPTPYAFENITKTMTSTGFITVTGMAILDNELFIATKKNNDIEVYDSKNYVFRRLLRLSELNDPWDMCSSSQHKCLYIASGYNNCSDDMRFEATVKNFFPQRPCNFYGKILKVNVIGNTQESWYIGEYFGTLSITLEGNIVLTVPVGSNIVVYDTDGKCLREINMSTDYNLKVLLLQKRNYFNYLICPSHGENLPNGNFVVSYFVFRIDEYYPRNQMFGERSYTDGLCMINAEGQMIKIFPGKPGSGFGELSQPWYLAVDQDVAVLVIERNSKRISLLKQNLEYKRKLVSKKHGLSNPYRMCLDGANGRLLVTNTDSDKEHVLIYNIKDRYTGPIMKIYDSGDSLAINVFET